MKTIGFIGTGVMGKSIAGHLLDAGYKVNVHNRTKSKTDDLVKDGAVWKDTPKEIIESSEITFTMVGYPDDVKQIYFGEDGIFESLQEGQTVIDLTTSTPTLAIEIYEKAREVGAYSLDAPVSGGDSGARNKTLTVMIGGDEDVYDEFAPIIEIFSGSKTLQGEAGSGQHTKMANQIMVAGTMTGLSELLVYAEAAGLDLEQVLATVGNGAAANWSLDNYGPRILEEDFEPGFYVKHFVKDLKITLDEAEKMNLDLPATKKAEELYETLENNELGDKGTQALIKLWWAEG